MKDPIELETPAPVEVIAPVKEIVEVAEQLTDKALDKKISTIVEEKITLAKTAQDNEEEIPPGEEEEEEEEEKSFGVFPALLISGVVVVGLLSFFLKNSPDTSPTSPEENSDG